MKKLKYLLILFLCFSFSTPILADNDDVLPSSNEDMILVSENNLYLENDIQGSSFVAGNNVETKGQINGIGFIAGNNVKIGNKIDYLLTAGNNIDINSNVEKDVFVVANIITLAKDGIIGRDFIVAANEVNILGFIERDSKIYASTVNLKGATISGNIEISANHINIDENTTIVGNLKYNGDAETNIKTVAIGTTETYESKEIKVTFMDTLLAKTISNAAILLVFLIFVLLYPRVFEKLNKKLESATMSTPFELFVKGFFALIIIPFIIILLFTSVIGVSLGLLLLVFYILAIYLAKLFVGYIVGKLLLTKLLKKEDNILLDGFIGVVILYILSLIPYINSITTFITLFIGFGMIYIIAKPEKNKN